MSRGGRAQGDALTDVPSTGGDRRLVLGLFVFALAIRLAAQFVLGSYESPDTWEYDEIARSLLVGQGYRFHFFGAEWLTFGFPAFPLLLAGLHALGGGPDAYGPVLVGIALISAALAPLAYALARELYDTRAAAIAGMIVALDPPLVLFAGRVHELTLDAFLLASVVLVVMRYARGHYRSGLLLGALIGISLIARPTIAMLGALSGALLALRWRSKYALAGAAIALVIAAPWTVRNALVLGGAGAASPYNCVTLWMGNNPNASGGPVTPEGISVFDVMDPDLRVRTFGRPERVQGAIFCGEVMTTWRSDPLGAAGWWATKFGYFWWFPPSAGAWYPSGWIEVYKVGYLIEAVLAIAGVGAVIARGWRIGLAVVALELFIIAAAQSVAYVEGRHRLVVEPTLAALAAIGISWLWSTRWLAAGHRPAARSAADPI